MHMLMHSWTYWLAAGALLFCFLPVSYGWGLRGWGPPLPSYLQRRRLQRAGHDPTSSIGRDYLAWGIGGDLVWVLMGFEILFVVALFIWA